MKIQAWSGTWYWLIHRFARAELKAATIVVLPAGGEALVSLFTTDGDTPHWIASAGAYFLGHPTRWSVFSKINAQCPWTWSKQTYSIQVWPIRLRIWCSGKATATLVLQLRWGKRLLTRWSGWIDWRTRSVLLVCHWLVIYLALSEWPGVFCLVEAMYFCCFHDAYSIHTPGLGSREIRSEVLWSNVPQRRNTSGGFDTHRGE